MLEKQSYIDQIEITRNGTVQVRMALVIVDGEQELAHSWHRTSVEPGGDVEAQMELVNDHLAQMGYPPISVVEVAKVRTQADVAWTPEVVTAYRAMLKDI